MRVLPQAAPLPTPTYRWPLPGRRRSASKTAAAPGDPAASTPTCPSRRAAPPPPVVRYVPTDPRPELAGWLVAKGSFRRRRGGERDEAGTAPSAGLGVATQAVKAVDSADVPTQARPFIPRLGSPASPAGQVARGDFL